MYDYGINRWSEAQADRFQKDLYAQFQKIADAPYRWRPVDNIKEGLRVCVYEGYSIFYFINDNTVEIMAIIGTQDTESRLSE